MSTRKIHLDTDIGGAPDDVCALAVLLRWRDVEIAGITTVTEQGGRRAGYVHAVLCSQRFLTKLTFGLSPFLHDRILLRRPST